MLKASTPPDHQISSSLFPHIQSHSCPSLLPYLLPYDFKLSEIAYGRFQTVLVYYIRCPASRHVDSISEGFGGLVSGGEIRSSVNGITEKNPMFAVLRAYVVRRRESLSRIGMEFGTTFWDMEAVNGLETYCKFQFQVTYM
ncbi:hypothetical protein ACOSQ3_026371 [Xanthoceras sorbifolium]